MLKYPFIVLLVTVLLQCFRHYAQTSAYHFYHDRNRRSQSFHVSGLSTQTELKVMKDCEYGLCEEIDDYPEEKIDGIVEKSEVLKKYFSSQTKVDISARSGTPGKPLCASKTQTYFYKRLNNTRDLEMHIVNHGDYQQGVALETCVDDTSSCSSGDKLFDEKTKCEQRHSSRVLAALAKDSEQVEFDTFRLPSCCVCLIV